MPEGRQIPHSRLVCQWAHIKIFTYTGLVYGALFLKRITLFLK